MANPTTATVGEDAAFTGRFAGQDLVVLGRIEGDVELKGSLRVGKQGHVKAKVTAAVVEIEGEFEGEVRADTLSLSDTAKAKGTFVAKRLNVREGAILEGAVNPTGPKPAMLPTPVKPAPVPSSSSGPGAPAPAPAAPAPPTTPTAGTPGGAPAGPGSPSGTPGGGGQPPNPKPEGGNPGA